MIDAHYFDGRSTRRHPVTLVIEQRVLTMRGASLRRSTRLSRMRISEALENAPRLLHFADGSHLEVADASVNQLLVENRYRQPRIVHWQQQWRRSLACLVCLVLVLICGYQWGMPWSVEQIARQLPPSVERGLGEQALAQMDKLGAMRPSRLPPNEQARLRVAFDALRQPHGEHTAHRLEFRESASGPNAFALPGGIMVMTDQLVTTAGNDGAVLGVLAHELGHVEQRHALRGLMQAAGVGLVLNLALGDISSVLAIAPAFLLEQSYSRQFEREADQYAIDMLKANRLPLAPLADLFEDMADERQGLKQEPADYMSSHPSDAERIARFRQADAEK